MIEQCGLIPAVLMLASKDVAGTVATLAGALASVAIGIAAIKKKRQQRAAERSRRNPTGVGAVTSRKEKDMAFVSVITSKSGMVTQTGGAASHIHPIALLWFFVWLFLAFAVLIPSVIVGDETDNYTLIFTALGLFLGMLGIAFIFLFCLKVADQWDRVVVLRLGKFKAVQEPGVFWLIPFADTVAKWIDTRVKTSDLLAEETLTRDTVPVDVDAVMFWMVYDPRKAALEVEDFRSAVTWAAQTALRDLIGKTELAELLVGRDVLDAKLQEIIDERTEPWGVSVQSVEIREIKIPRDLQDTMSRQAQAERERQARVILGESEKQIAQSFADAAEKYKDNPTALHLRAMNMLFEGLKEKGSLMIVPSSAIDSMNLGAIGGLASLGLHARDHGGELPPTSS